MSNTAPIEVRLLTRVIDDGDFHTLEKAQISEQFFSLPDCLEVYRYIREVFYNPTSVGMVPSRELIAERFPTFYPCTTADGVGILAQELRKEKVRIDILSLAQNIQVEADRNPLAAMATLRAEITKISSLAEVGEDLSLAASYQTLRSNYDTVAESGGITGIPFPWHPVNEETQGMKGSEFIVIYGRPGSMKSFISIYMACHAYIHSRRRVMFYTREMNPILVAQRMAACIAAVDYKSFKNGKLQPELKKRAFGILEDLLDDEKSAGANGFSQPTIKIVSDRNSSGSGGGVSWLKSKIRDIKPHIVFVDGMYLMRDDRSGQRTIDWKAIAQISQDLKLASQEFDIPIVGVTQANRSADKAKGTDLTEIGFTDSIGQDADVVARVRKKDRIDENKQRHTELHLTFPKIREGALQGIVIGGEPCTDFLFKRVITNIEEDDDEQAGKAGNQPQGGSGPTYKRNFVDPRIPLKRK